MPQLATVTIVGVIILAVMVVIFLKVRQKDLVAAFMDKRRPTSKLVSRADYVEGAERIPVALSLTETALYYENPDLEASFDLDRIDAIARKPRAGGHARFHKQLHESVRIGAMTMRRQEDAAFEHGSEPGLVPAQTVRIEECAVNPLGWRT